jgi:hypothetical protein
MSDRTMQYHEMAAFVFLLFLVAKDRNTGALYQDFHDQVKNLPSGMAPQYDAFHKLVMRVFDAVVHDPATHPTPDPARRDKFLRMFNTAHEAIRDLFLEMAADNLWDVCRPVDFEKVKSIALLTMMDMETRPEFESRFSVRRS